MDSVAIVIIPEFPMYLWIYLFWTPKLNKCYHIFINSSLLSEILQLRILFKLLLQKIIKIYYKYVFLYLFSCSVIIDFRKNKIYFEIAYYLESSFCKMYWTMHIWTKKIEI